MQKTLLAFGLGLTVGLTSLVGARTFPDVNPNDWFAEYVQQIAQWGIISGNDDGTFAPGRAVNRAELGKMFVLFDERTDKKIQTVLQNQPPAPPQVEPEAETVLPSVMYLQMRNNPAANCPTGWTEADYGYYGEEQERVNRRTCLTTKKCETLDLIRQQNNPSLNCPDGWTQASYGRVQNEDWQRTCYICEN